MGTKLHDWGAFLEVLLRKKETKKIQIKNYSCNATELKAVLQKRNDRRRLSFLRKSGDGVNHMLGKLVFAFRSYRRGTDEQEKTMGVRGWSQRTNTALLLKLSGGPFAGRTPPASESDLPYFSKPDDTENKNLVPSACVWRGMESRRKGTAYIGINDEREKTREAAFRAFKIKASPGTEFFAWLLDALVGPTGNTDRFDTAGPMHGVRRSRTQNTI